jgi:hypothetical protein
MLSLQLCATSESLYPTNIGIIEALAQLAAETAILGR